MDHNLDCLSDTQNVANVLPDRPGVWTPELWDSLPLLKIDLPPVFGVPPGAYDLMEIRIKAEHFHSVDVTVKDSNDQVIFLVSFV